MDRPCHLIAFLFVFVNRIVSRRPGCIVCTVWSLRLRNGSVAGCGNRRTGRGWSGIMCWRWGDRDGPKLHQGIVAGKLDIAAGGYDRLGHKRIRDVCGLGCLLLDGAGYRECGRDRSGWRGGGRCRHGSRRLNGRRDENRRWGQYVPPSCSWDCIDRKDAAVKGGEVVIGSRQGSKGGGDIVTAYGGSRGSGGGKGRCTGYT